MDIQIDAQKREIGKKSLIKKIRKDGFIPGIIYSSGKNGKNIIIPKVEFRKQYKKAIGAVAFYKIKLADKEYTTFLKEKQIDPVSRDFVHLDFVELRKGQKITLDVPIKFVGTPVGAEEGGIIDIVKRSLEITCMPKDVPDNIEIDISHLKIGESIYFGDLDLKNMETDIPDDSSLLNVLAPMSEEEFEASLEAVTEEPEELEEAPEEIGEELEEAPEETAEGEKPEES